MNFTERNSNLAAANKFYELVQQSEWEQAGAFVTDDFQVIEAPDLPFGGVSKGKDAIRTSFQALVHLMDITGIDFHQRTQGGEYLVSILDIRAKGEGGRDLSLGIAEVMRFRDGLICEVKPYYFDHEVVREAVAAKSK